MSESTAGAQCPFAANSQYAANAPNGQAIARARLASTPRTLRTAKRSPAPAASASPAASRSRDRRVWVVAGASIISLRAREIQGPVPIGQPQRRGVVNPELLNSGSADPVTAPAHARVARPN